MPSYIKAPEADIDLLEIWSYIAQNSFEVADNFLDRLEAGFEQLAEQPLMGRKREELRPGLRSLTVGNYFIFYWVIDDRVEVVRVLNATRDIEAIFAEPL